jgi:protein-L-isoaspartate(D-aspartate) O-methyltransferase
MPLSLPHLELSVVRRLFAEELRFTAPIVRNPAIAEAFASVPRERFLGPGPWHVRGTAAGPAGEDFTTPDADPRHVYHDVVVSLDSDRRLNNGGPSLWARCFDRLDIRPGERVLHVGAGTGYYSAILAELVGGHGAVHAVEIDGDLAERARGALARYPQVNVIAGDARSCHTGEVDLVVASAGMTHPAPLWLDRLADGGRLLIPLTTHWRGVLLKATRCGATYAAEALGYVSIFPCVGGQDAAAAERLRRALASGYPKLRALFRGEPPADASDCWYAGPGFWLSCQVPTDRRSDDR